MKKHLLTLFAAILFSASAMAQLCETAMLPSPAFTQITTSQTLDAEAAIYWVCAGVTLDISSSPGAAFYLENDVTINFNGTDGDAVTAKAGCVINNNTDQTVTVIANAASVTLNNNAGGTTFVGVECMEIVYTYALVDEASCAEIIHVDENTVESITMYPNPISKGETLNITLPGKANLNVFNSLGQKVLTMENFQGVLETKDIASGNYIISIELENETVHRRLRVL